MRLSDSKLISQLKLNEKPAQENSCTSKKTVDAPHIELDYGTAMASGLEISEINKQILFLANSGKPTLACQQLLLSRVQSCKQNPPNCNFSKPSHFYAICRDWNEEF